MILPPFLFSCNNASRKPANNMSHQGENIKEYDDNRIAKIISDQNLEKIVEDVKWRSYAMYCDSTAIFIDKFLRTKSNIKMGELRLKILSIILDTFHDIDDNDRFWGLKISLIYINSKNITYNVDNKTESYGEFLYKKNGLEKPLCICNDYGYWMSLLQNIHHSIKDSIRRSKIRVINTMQPEVIYYVRENANRIDPWFLSEAKKRGVFDSVLYPPAKIQEEISANKKVKQIPLSESFPIPSKYRDQVKPKHE